MSPGNRMMNAPHEWTYVENVFGTVTSQRVIYFRNKGWLSGGCLEAVLLQHVMSVRLERSHSAIIGPALMILGIAQLLLGSSMHWWGLVPFVPAVLLLWGTPLVLINTLDGDLGTVKGWPWHNSQATDFVDALRTQRLNLIKLKLNGL